jgi:hypothetical protein
MHEMFHFFFRMVNKPLSVLDPCLQENREAYEHGHCMHQECAIKLREHMKFRCPICRSMIIRSHCKSMKTSTSCTCLFRVSES